MEKTRAEFKEFVRFLKENMVLMPFKRNFKEQCEKRAFWYISYNSHFNNDDSNVVLTIKEYFNSLMYKYDAFGFAFEWAKTKEGHQFWEKLSYRWKENIFNKN